MDAPGTTPVGDTTDKTKRTPGKMLTAIGRWTTPGVDDDSAPVFTLLRNLGEAAKDKQITAAIKASGTGTYDVLVYRTYSKTYRKEERDVIA